MPDLALSSCIFRLFFFVAWAASGIEVERVGGDLGFTFGPAGVLAILGMCGSFFLVHFLDFIAPAAGTAG